MKKVKIPFILLLQLFLIWPATCVLSNTSQQVSLTPQEKAFLAAHPVITLGTEAAWEPYIIVKKDGTITGYDADILAQVNAVTGANFQLKAGVWREMQQAAQEHRIDGLSTGGIHEERKSYLNFSDIYISLSKILLVAKGNSINIHTQADLEGKRIALHRGNLVDEKLAQRFPHSEIVPLDTVEEVIRAVINNQVDGCFGNGSTLYLAQKAGLPYLQMALDLHAPLELAFGVRKDWPEAVTILNKGLRTIARHERLLIQQKWFGAMPGGSADGIQLNPEEKSWLRSHPVIRVHAPDLPPYQFDEDGEKGIIVDLMNNVADKLGISFLYQHDLSQSEALQQIKNQGDVDLFLSLPHSTVWEDFMDFSQGTSKIPLVIFALEDEQNISGMEDLSNKTVVVEKESAMDKRLSREFPTIKLLRVENSKTALKALSESQADAYIGNLTTTQYYLVKHGLSNIKVTAPTRLVNIRHTFAVHDDWAIFADILDRGLTSISSAELSLIQQKYFAIQVEKGVDLSRLLWIVGGLLLSLCFILFWNYRLQREVRIRRKAEQLLASRSEEVRKLSRAVEQSHSTVVITDTSGAIEFVNPAFTHSTGYKREEAIGQNPRILKSGQQDDTVYQDLWKTLTEGDVWHGELHNKRKDDSLYWEMATISPVKDKTGQTTHYVAVKEDITQRKLAEEKLIQAEQRAKNANQAKSDFLANMSHEIRTPMNAILGMTHLALQTDLNARQEGYIRNVDTSAKSLLGIINDILDFSKIEAGKLTLESTPFLLTDVMHRLEAMTRREAERKGLTMKSVIKSEVPPCLLGDPLRLGQILLNLTANAIKFTQEGTVTICVECLQLTPENGVLLQFSVTDTGIGMSNEQLDKLFHSFTQADSSTTRKFGGTGLGLTICKQLSRIMGGDIRVKSRHGSGSSFICCLPFAVSDQCKLKKVSPVFDAVAMAELRGVRVLLVEDNKINRQLARELLEMNHFSVRTAVNGREAVEAVQEESFAAVLMDIQMPVMDGIAATVAIRKIPSCKDLPIIAMTAEAMIEDREKCLNAGMSDHIGKPVEPNRLRQILLKWIPPQQQPAPARVKEKQPSGNMVELPGTLSGIDLRTGLRRAADNRGLFLQILTLFYEEHAQDPRRIREALHNRDQEHALRISHTAKGVAGSIGATELFKAAGAVDKAIKERLDAEIPSLLEEMERKLATVLKGLAPLFPPPADVVTGTETAHVDMNEVATLLKDIKEKMDELNPDVEEKAAELVQLLEGSPWYENGLLLLHQVEDIEFDTAEETVRLLLDSLKKHRQGNGPREC